MPKVDYDVAGAGITVFCCGAQRLLPGGNRVPGRTGDALVMRAKCQAADGRVRRLQDVWHPLVLRLAND